MSADIVLLEHNGPVATVVLNNPKKRNALTFAAWERLLEVVKELEADDGLRCVLVTGAGDHFAAGADISEFPEKRMSAAQAEVYGAVVAEAMDRLANLKHPTIAVIRGACTGGGLEIACCCDMRIAARSAKVGIPINRLGHSFAHAEMAAALSAIPAPVVLELLLEGRVLDADEAYAKGMLTRVVPDDGLEDDVEATAWRIAQGAPLAARGSKKTLRRLMDASPLTEAELKSGYALCDSEDYREGVRAFLAKEKPKFQGR
ncbi:MAG: enoyl-CoA hydratase-related protein [Rhodospirillaceae bacterium]